MTRVRVQLYSTFREYDNFDLSTTFISRCSDRSGYTEAKAKSLSSSII